MKRLYFLKNKFFCIVVLLTVSLLGNAQTVTNAEYFFDTEPGLGNGTPLAISTPGDSIDETFSISIAALSPGGHFLYIRTQDSNGKWSLHEPRAFTIAPPPTVSFALVSAEYFFDTVPAFGGGTPLTAFASADSIDLQTTVSTAGLTPGFHYLYIRTKDVNGRYSLSEPRSFYIVPPRTGEQIVAAEYFFNTDPGVGNGTPVAVAQAADSIDIVAAVTVPALSLGNHLLYMRTKNARGEWSLHEPRTVNVCTTYGADAGFAFDVEGNHVYFHDSSSYVESHKWTYGDGQEDTVQLNPHHVYATGGIYNVCLSATSVCGNDNYCSTVYINGIQAIQPRAGGQSGMVSVKITGYGFEPGSTVKLMKTGQTDILAMQTIFVSITELKVNFLFDNAPLGLWDLAVISPNLNDTLFSSFEIQPLKAFDPWVDVTGPRRILVNRNQTIRIAFGNRGNTMAFAVPIHIRVTGNRNPRMGERVDQSQIPQAMLDTMVSYPSTHFYMRYDSLTGDSAKYAYIVVPYVEPGVTQYVDIIVQSTIIGTHYVAASVGQPIYNETQLDSLGLRTNCNFLPPCAQCALDIAGFVPVVGCGTALLSMGCAIGGAVSGYGNQSVYDVVSQTGGAILGCATTGGDEAASILIASFTVSSATGLLDASGSGSCPACTPDDVSDWTTFATAASLDPNVKNGPLGLTPENYISGEEPIQYGVYFENADSATAPANEVLIVDTLDSSVLDLSTFHFTQFGFGDSLYELNTEKASFTTDIDLRPAKNIILRVRGHLDTVKGIMTTKFTSFDPFTMALTDSIDEGFLPPNITKPEGEGFVSFSVRAKTGLPHLTAIHNTAHIYFDANAPITTPVWLNTIDLVKPQSAVSTLPATHTNGDFLVSWGGTDAHAGVMDYSIYVSDNNSPYTLWRYAARHTSQIYHGQPGHTYKFYSVARDYVMNIEDTPTVHDAITSVVSGISELPGDGDLWMKQNAPNPFSQNSVVEFHLPEAMNISLALTDLAGRNVKSLYAGHSNSGINRVELQRGNLAQGIYLLRLTTPTGTRTKRLIIHN